MKRRHHEEHINHERWAIPYGDLITLLLALFVVMYAVSAVNETKFRVMAQSINEAFNGTGKVIEPIREATPAAQVPLPNQSRAPVAAPIAKIDVPIPPRNLPLPGHEGAAPTRQESASINTATAANTTVGKTEDASLSQIADEVQRAMKPLIDKNLVSVRQTKDWLEIEVRTDILFPVGVAKLQGTAEEVLRKLAGILGPFPNAMRIEGYTDNTPIATATFPSNWELSAARAATVARLLTTSGVDPHRVGIVGWGEFRPTTDNTSDEGRNRNRRVLIVVMSDKAEPARFYSDADRLPVASAAAATPPTPATNPVAGTR
ncbi:chemotaxis protein MotB [Luteibacter sp. OK325]|uniref:flagellar motor protein MotD n=1 Tax=Luteibacter sp. OK325 TaxID=2135670 RepID=UPI000D3A79DC|nr:flagellar motor protein MotD [Luteibacter sp. OK325]PTR28431.1 chemotaxis protein MotB [Luteibacter sp. OK325]